MSLAYTDIDTVVAAKEGAEFNPVAVPTGKMKKANTAGAGNGQGSFLTDTGLQVRNKPGRLCFVLENTDPTYDCYVRFIPGLTREGLDLEPRDVIVPAGGFPVIVGPFSSIWHHSNKEDSGVDGPTRQDYLLLQFSTDNNNNATTGYMGSGNENPLNCTPLYIPEKVS